MSKKNIIIGGLIILVLLYVFSLVKGKYNNNVPVVSNEQSSTVVQTSPTTISNQQANEVVVEYQDGGFGPKSITVKVGITVKWVNNTDNPMWVASAFHPTHNELPGFDQLTSVKRDGIYTYTFTKVGSWKYHNHVAPSENGVVVVEN